MRLPSSSQITDKWLLANGYLAWFLWAILNACSDKLFKMHYILYSNMTCSHREHFDMEMCNVCENHWAKHHNYRRDLHDNVTQPTWLLQSKTGGAATDKINDCDCVYHSEGPGGTAAPCVWNCFSINVGACGSDERAALGFRCSHTRPFLVCTMHFLGFCCAPSWQPACEPPNAQSCRNGVTASNSCYGGEVRPTNTKWGPFTNEARTPLSLRLSCSSIIGMHLVLLPLVSTAAPRFLPQTRQFS